MIAENHNIFPGRLFLFYDLAGRATSGRLQGEVSWLNCTAEKLARIADEGCGATLILDGGAGPETIAGFLGLIG